MIVGTRKISGNLWKSRHIIRRSIRWTVCIFQTFVFLLLQIASWYQFIRHNLLPSQSTKHIRQKFQWTSQQLKSAYLDLQYVHWRSSRFHAEHLSFLWWWFTPFLSPLFLLYSVLGQPLLFKCKHRVPIHGHMYGKLHLLKLKCWLSDGKKVQDCDYVFRSSTTFQRRKE